MSTDSTTRAVLHLTRDARAAMLAHARSAHPDECCGALLGVERAGSRSVSVAFPVDNEARDARARFFIGPSSVLCAETEAERRGLVVVGFYHSHPAQPPQPSARDIEHAWPWYSYVIVGAGDALAAWRLRDDRTAFDAVPVIDEAPA